MIKADCHIHAVLDGVDWKAALHRHEQQPHEGVIRNMLETYHRQGYTYLRDGGDRWGAGILARKLAPEYGICYRTPGAPLCQKGHYGGFIGVTYETMAEYAGLVKQARCFGVDFIKIMVSGLMDFHKFGVLTEEGLPSGQIKELIHIAHEEGMAVMAHANGGETVLAAAEAGVDSVEHGAYLTTQALAAMAETGTVWVPTLSTVGNLLGKDRFPRVEVEKILENSLERIAEFRAMGGLIAPGTDAGAWAVPHGCETEQYWLEQAGVDELDLEKGISAVLERF